MRLLQDSPKQRLFQGGRDGRLVRALIALALSGNSLSHPPFPCLYEGATTPTHPLTPALLPWISHKLGHQSPTEPRAVPPMDVQQGHTLPHMLQEPWVSPYVLFGWWSSPRELWGDLAN